MSTPSALARGLGRAVLAALLALATAGGLLAAGVVTSTAAPSVSSVPDGAGDSPRTARPTAHSITIAVVLGASGTDAADVLAPYEVFARSAAVTVYTVAASAAPAPVGGGLAIVPDHTFAEVANGAVGSPDLVVVPAVERPDGTDEAPARDFVAGLYRSGARVLGVCAGARLLAASGILDGRQATSHWSRLSALRSSRPQVRWADGVRYLQDGRITTTAGVSSGIPGALRVLADLAGPAEAERVGQLIDYPGWQPDQATAIPAHRFGADDLGVLANLLLPWGRPAIEVRLPDGIGEIDAAALLEVYSYAQAAGVTAVSSSGTVVTRHGLTLRTAAVQPSAGHPGLVAGQLRSHTGRTGFDAAFEQLSRDASPAVVQSVAKMLEYPLDRVSLQQPSAAAGARPPALAVVVALVALAAGSLPYIIRRRRPAKSR